MMCCAVVRYGRLKEKRTMRISSARLRTLRFTPIFVFGLWLAACGEPTLPQQDEAEPQVIETPAERDIIASNAFFYYADLEGAVRFYEDLLGLETVADYGFAKIMRVAETSYLTLVDAESGMHTADEPKTVAIALLTDELDEWYEYLKEEGIPTRSDYNPVEGRPHHGFVVEDPEGYFLEFERFNPHPENEKLMPMLAEMKSLYPVPGSSTRRPENLGFKATVLWLYYKDMEAIVRFYEEVMGFDLVVDQGWAKVFAVSPTGFIGPVDGEKGMHSWTEKKGVTVSFITTNVDRWFDYMKSQDRFELRHQEVVEEERAGVRTFVGYDPEGYYLEFDTFMEKEESKKLLQLLEQ
jgi:catechol 2,3-dioxygenase-like lactoylglutathione lyase family enzyme